MLLPLHEAYESLRRVTPGSRPYGTERGTTHAKTRRALDDGLKSWADTLGALCQSLVRTLGERSLEPDISIFDVLTKPRFWKDAETVTARHLVGRGWVLQAYAGYTREPGPADAPTDSGSASRWVPPSGWCLLENASIVEYTGSAPIGERRNGEGRRIEFATERVYFPPSVVPVQGRHRGTYDDFRADLLQSLGVPEPYTREHLDAVAPIHREIAMALESWNSLLGAYSRGLEADTEISPPRIVCPPRLARPSAGETAHRPLHPPELVTSGSLRRPRPSRRPAAPDSRPPWPWRPPASRPR